MTTVCHGKSPFFTGQPSINNAPSHRKTEQFCFASRSISLEALDWFATTLHAFSLASLRLGTALMRQNLGVHLILEAEMMWFEN